MNKRFISIGIAVVMAVVAVVMVNSYLQREKQKYVKEDKMVPVTIATRDIPKGSTLIPNMLAKKGWPEQYLQPAVLHNPQYAFGKIAITDILKGEMILKTKLTDIPRADDSLAVRLPEGKRGFTIIIDSLSAVIGQIKPGDHIDIIGSFPYTQNIGGNNVTENVSVTLFQNILVMDRRPSGKDYIFILALSPQEAGILTYAMGIGTLRLTLRHALDDTVESVPPVESNVLWQYILSNFGKQLFQPEQKQEVKVIERVKEEPTGTLEIFRGTDKSRMIVD